MVELLLTTTEVQAFKASYVNSTTTTQRKVPIELTTVYEIRALLIKFGAVVKWHVVHNAVNTTADETTMKLLLSAVAKRDQAFFNEEGEYGNLLQCACSRGAVHMVKILLVTIVDRAFQKSYVNTGTAKESRLPMKLTTDHEIHVLLMKAGAEMEKGMLHKAVSDDAITIVRKLLIGEPGVWAYKVDEQFEGDYPLHLVRSSEVCQELLKWKSNVDWVDASKCTCLCRAISNGYVDVVKTMKSHIERVHGITSSQSIEKAFNADALLLQKVRDHDERDSEQQHRLLEIVLDMILLMPKEKQTDILNKRVAGKYPMPLIWLVSRYCERQTAEGRECIRKMLEGGAKRDAGEKNEYVDHPNGYSAFLLLLKLLVDKGTKRETDICVTAVRIFMETAGSADLTQVTEGSGLPVLHVMVIAAENQCNRTGRSYDGPLNGIAKYLLGDGMGVDLDAQDKDRVDIHGLLEQVSKRNDSVKGDLYNLINDPDVIKTCKRMNKMRRLISLVKRPDNETMVEDYLKVDRPDPNASDNMGKTALHYAAELGYHKVIRVIVEHVPVQPKGEEDDQPPARMGVQTKHDGWTVLNYAIEFKHFECMMKILEYTKPHALDDVIRATTTLGDNLLYFCLGEQRYDERIFTTLLHSALDPNDGNCAGLTPLHRAALFGNYEAAVSLLVFDGINPNIQDTNGDTPLIIAAKRRKWDIIRLLLQYDVDRNIKNNEGKISYDYVQHFPYSDLFLDASDIFRSTFTKVNVDVQLAPRQKWWSEGFEGFDSDKLPSDSDIITVDAKRYRGSCANFTPGVQLDLEVERNSKGKNFQEMRKCYVVADMQARSSIEISGAVSIMSAEAQRCGMEFQSLKINTEVKDHVTEHYVDWEELVLDFVDQFSGDEVLSSTSTVGVQEEEQQQDQEQEGVEGDGNDGIEATSAVAAERGVKEVVKEQYQEVSQTTNGTIATSSIRTTTTTISTTTLLSSATKTTKVRTASAKKKSVSRTKGESAPTVGGIDVVRIANVIVIAGPTIVPEEEWCAKLKDKIAALQLHGVHIHFSVIGYGAVHPRIHRLAQVSANGTFLHGSPEDVELFHLQCRSAIRDARQKGEAYSVTVAFTNGISITGTLLMGGWKPALALSERETTEKKVRAAHKAHVHGLTEEELVQIVESQLNHKKSTGRCTVFAELDEDVKLDWSDARFNCSKCTVHVHKDAKQIPAKRVKLRSEVVGRHQTLLINYQLFFQKIVNSNCKYTKLGRKWILETQEWLSKITAAQLQAHVKRNSSPRHNRTTNYRTELLTKIAERSKSMCWFAEKQANRYNPRSNDFTVHTVLSSDAGLGNLVKLHRCRTDSTYVFAPAAEPQPAWRPPSPSKPITPASTDYEYEGEAEVVQSSPWGHRLGRVAAENARRSTPTSPSRPLWSPTGASRGIPELLKMHGQDDDRPVVGSVPKSPRSESRSGSGSVSPKRDAWRPSCPSKSESKTVGSPGAFDGLASYDSALFAMGGRKARRNSMTGQKRGGSTSDATSPQSRSSSPWGHRLKEVWLDEQHQSGKLFAAATKTKTKAKSKAKAKVTPQRSLSPAKSPQTIRAQRLKNLEQALIDGIKVATTDQLVQQQHGGDKGDGGDEDFY